MAPPFNPLAPCCDPLVDDGCGADPNGEFCEKSDRGEKQYCMTLNTYIGGLRCRCADATTALSLRKLGWEMKNNQIARVDRPLREVAALLPPPDIAPNALIDTQAQRDKCFSACRAQWKREWWLGFYIWTDQKWVGECANKCMSRNRQEAQRQGSHPDMMY